MKRSSKQKLNRKKFLIIFAKHNQFQINYSAWCIKYKNKGDAFKFHLTVLLGTIFVSTNEEFVDSSYVVLLYFCLSVLTTVYEMFRNLKGLRVFKIIVSINCIVFIDNSFQPVSFVKCSHLTDSVHPPPKKLIFFTPLPPKKKILPV